MTSVTAVPTGHQQYKMQYPGEKQSAAQARKDVRLILLTWALPSLCDDAELVATELLANAIEHAKAPHVNMSIERLSEWIEISAFDPCVSRPSVRTASSQNERGRGMALIEALCSEWGCDSAAPNKRVWVRLAL